MATGGRPWVPAVLAGAIFLAVWTPLQPRREHVPTSDLYTHLTVTRHLMRGDGFLTDVAYPLSFAFPFARALPQPLIHRMPGFAVLLTAPYLTAGGDPERTLDHVRLWSALTLALTAGLGVWGLERCGRGRGAGMWLVMLGVSPLLSFAVGWGHDEVAAAALLLAVWLVVRAARHDHPAAAGVLAGLLALTRLELAWVPIVWWLALRGRGRAGWTALAVMLIVLTPWSLRGIRVTGQPFFTLQGVAEHVKDTRAFPGYSVYRGLEPQPLLRTMLDDPEPVARKAVRGLRFYRDDLPLLLPWPYLAALGALSAPAAWSVIRRRRRPPRRSPLGVEGPDSDPRRRAGPAAAAGTLILLILLYAPFDHSLRHLIPVLPVLCWELSLAGAGALPRGGRGREIGGGVCLAAAALAIGLALPCRLSGWEQAAADAARTEPAVRMAAAGAKTAPAGVIFCEYSAVPWFADRPGVWSPLDEGVAQRIRTLLAATPVRGAMAGR